MLKFYYSHQQLHDLSKSEVVKGEMSLFQSFSGAPGANQLNNALSIDTQHHQVDRFRKIFLCGSCQDNFLIKTISASCLRS